MPDSEPSAYLTKAQQSLAEEQDTLEPYAQQIMDVIRPIDPEATYSLAPPIDPGIWIMNVYVRPSFASARPPWAPRVRRPGILRQAVVGRAIRWRPMG